MLDTLCKMRNAGFGMRNGKAPMAADDEGQMANDGCRMADDECQEAEGELEIEIEGGDCDEGPSSEPMKEACSGPVVGYDSNRVIDDSSNDKIGILSHEGAYAASQPRQGDDAGQCFPDHVTTPQKAPIKANLGSTQSPQSQEFESEKSGAEGREQSQFAQQEAARKSRPSDGRQARQSGPRRVGRDAQGSELLRLAGFPPLDRSDDVDSPGNGQMERGKYQVTLADLTKSSESRTKEDL